METRRRVRPAIVVAGCLLAVAAAMTAVVWRQGDFWRASAANYLRERLAKDFGADFQTAELRGQWFPPGLSLGHVTLHPPQETWVLTADDVRISFNVYAVIFGRERLGSVVVERPRLFVRERSRPAAASGAAPSRPAEAAVADAARRLQAFLRPPFPLRVLEVSEGRVEVLGRGGGRSVASGIELSVLVSRGSARAVLDVRELSHERRGARLELGRIEGEALLEEGRAVVRKLSAARGPITGSVSGTVEYAGTLALKGRISAAVDQLAALAGHAGAAAGRARFDGMLAGSWTDPRAAGSLLVRNLSFRGRSLPEARARVSFGGERLAWTDLALVLGDGAVGGSGEIDFSAGGPRYRVDAEARGVDLSKLPGIAGPAAKAGRLRGSARWEGAGLGGAASGGGWLKVAFAPEPAPEDEIALEADVALGGGRLTVGAFRVAAPALEASGSGSWNREAGFAGRVAGTVADLGRLFPAAAVPVGGKAAFAGELGLGPAGPVFAGELTLAGGTVGPVGGIAAAAKIAADSRRVRITEATLSWQGARGSAAGSIELPSGRLEIEAAVERLDLSGAAPHWGVDPALLSGSLGGSVRARGTLREPEVYGNLAGVNLAYGPTSLEEASLGFAYAARRLGVTSLHARRGTSQLSFRGEVRDGGALAGEFEIPGFVLADFVPAAGLDLAGALRGRVSGSAREPRIDGRLTASRVRYRGFDFKGGELEVDYRGGKIALEGWLAVPENRLRMVLEPSQGWRFEADLALRQLAPEIVRSGAGALPAPVGRVLGRGAFLAAGRLEASGRLREAASIRAQLHLDTFWVQAAGRTLQNRAPVRLSWREGGLAVESFSLAGEQYHLDVSGGGSPASGWNLQAGGAVDLALLRDFWPELEDVVGTGELLLTLGGPWTDPLPEGTLVVRQAFVRARTMPEPLERLEARITLRGRTITATGLSGTLGGGAFRGRGTYDMAADRLDADVEGRLDLAFFRARLPAARDLRGPLEVSLHLAGPIASPGISGEIEVVDAELFARPFPAKFTHLQGRVTIGADRLDVRDLRGQTGGGTVRLTGFLDWSRTPLRVDAQLEGSGILLSLAGALKAQNDLRLRLQGDLRDLRLSGEVRILKARYLREFGEKPPALVAAAAPGAGAEPGADLSRMALDVKVRATDNVWISNRMARIEAAVALDIGGTLGAPVVSGEITGIQGEAFYLSRQFRLESGSLRFVPPAAIPRLDVQASTTVGETQILFLMEGPLNRPEYHLTSLPGMSQEDLIALLTIGETRSGLERRGESAATAGAAVFTAVPLVTALGDEMRSATGLETLKLEPIVGEGNQVSARVTLGTHLSDRLFVSYSQNLGATEDQQVAVQYHLLDYLSLLGQELRQDVYSLDLVFRYSFK